jgi:hypothetical protein
MTAQRRRVIAGVIAQDAPEAWMSQLEPAKAQGPVPRWAFTLRRDGQVEEELHTQTDATAAATLRAVADRISPATAAPPRARRWPWHRRQRR